MAMKLKKFNNWDNFFKFSTGNRYPDNLLITLVLQEYKKITISTDNGKISGIAKKIDADGALILSTKNGSMRILVGDVSH